MKKLINVLMICAVFLCAAASCSDNSDDNYSKPEKATAEAATEAETTTTKAAVTTKKVTTTAAVTTTTVTTTHVTDPEKAALAAEVPEEAVKLAEKYFTFASDFDIVGITSCFYPEDLFKLMKDSGDLDYMQSLSDSFSEAKEGETAAVEVKVTEAEKLSDKLIAEAQSLYTSTEEQMNSPVSHKVSYGYKLRADCTSEGETFDEEFAVALLDDKEWVVLPFEDELQND